MRRPNRRQILGAAAAGTAALALGGFPAIAAGAAPKVVVVGGGFGGATAAKYIRLMDRRIDVTLVEREPRYITCPFSSLVLAGSRSLPALTHDLAPLGVEYALSLVQDSATAVDLGARRIRLAGGQELPYDRLVLAPGIDVDFSAVPGYDAAAAQLAPHAWKAGAQTLLL